MVKEIDESDPLPDHVGWLLWQASRTWLRDFVDAMRAEGHDWFSESRATLMGHIPRAGVRQSRLIERLAMTKQAVQQLLDGLEGEDVLVRLPDPDDGRGRFVRYTPKGLAALRDADRLKTEIERRYAERLGADRMAALIAALKALERDP